MSVSVPIDAVIKAPESNVWLGVQGYLCQLNDAGLLWDTRIDVERDGVGDLYFEITRLLVQDRRTLDERLAELSRRFVELGLEQVLRDAGYKAATLELMTAPVPPAEVPVLTDDDLEAIGVEELPPILVRTLRELRAWHAVGHGESCHHRRCLRLREVLAANGVLDLVYKYPIRQVGLWKIYTVTYEDGGHPIYELRGDCNHGVSLLEACKQCGAEP